MGKRVYKSLASFYNAGEKILFLGNGINQLSKGFSWDDLLTNICNKAKLDTSRGGKTYPLYFEELSFRFDLKGTVEQNISLLKEMIAADALKLMPNDFHRRLVDCGYYTHFFTTNYDYCIELAIDANCLPALKKNDKRSGKYSLYRFNEVTGHRVWHLHGECDNGRKKQSQDSILIGFEHYSDYLDKIHRLIKSDTGKGLAEQMSGSRDNWVHLFFTRDIDIIGFGIDFTESHLWFLLNFRARLKRKGARISNTIRWIIPSFTRDKVKDKTDILSALGVVTEEVPTADKDYEGFYSGFISGLTQSS